MKDALDIGKDGNDSSVITRKTLDFLDRANDGLNKSSAK